MAISDNLKNSIRNSGVENAEELIRLMEEADARQYKDEQCETYTSEEVKVSEVDVCDIDTPDERDERLKAELEKAPVIPEYPEVDASYFGNPELSGYPLGDSDKIKCAGSCLKNFDNYGEVLKNDAERVAELSEGLVDKEEVLDMYKLHMEYWLKLMLSRCKTERFSSENLTRETISQITRHEASISSIQTDSREMEINKSFVLSRLAHYKDLMGDEEYTEPYRTVSSGTLGGISSQVFFLYSSLNNFANNARSFFSISEHKMSINRDNRSRMTGGGYLNIKNILSNININNDERADPSLFIKRFEELDSSIRQRINNAIISVIPDNRVRAIASYMRNASNNDLIVPELISTNGLIGGALESFKNMANDRRRSLKIDYTQILFDDFKAALGKFFDIFKEVNDDRNEIIALTRPERFENDLNNMICCGKPVLDGKIDFAPVVETGIADISHNTFDVNNTPTMLDINYWKKYANFLTLQNLTPSYWTVGLLIPTSAGIKKIKLPTIWKALSVIKLPFGFIVIFLTINGIVISPVVYFVEFKPLADAKSTLKVLFRGANQTVRSSKTGNENSGLPIVNNIDTNPEVSKGIPFSKDDLPTMKRMGLNNPPYVSYLDMWLKAAKPYMGFP